MGITFFLFMNLVIDIGNTRVKYAFFNSQNSFKVEVLPLENWQEFFLELLTVHRPFNLILASVIPLEKTFIKKLFTCVKKVIIVDEKTPLPFENLYGTPHTLGVDRLALIAATTAHFSHKPVLVIDVGTCITYDFKNAQNQYLGGAISPGITTRYKSLSAYTKALPELSPVPLKSKKINGQNTNDCIHNGIMKGVFFEINGFIADYQKYYPYTVFIITGGDAIYLSNHLKKTILARPNFVLEGLFEILLYNLPYA